MIALWAGKFIGFLIRLIDESRGSNLSGEKAMAIDPKMISHFKGIDPEKTIFITGTNGKSTTTNLLVHILRSNGKKVVANLEGANLLHGVATTLIKASSLTGRVSADYFVFETDERYLKAIREQLPAANIMMTNLQKDQAQRNGEPDFVKGKIHDAVVLRDTVLYVNNEEPRVKSFESEVKKTITYGTARHRLSCEPNEELGSVPCPVCRRRLTFKYLNNSGMGPFECGHCGFRSEEKPDYLVTDIDFEKQTGKVNGVEFQLPFAPPFMYYNAAATICAAHEFAGIDIKDAAESLKSFVNIGGRFEDLHYRGKTIRYMRFKQENPDTLQSFLNFATEGTDKRMIAIGLDPIIDEVPYFLETFYTYDCDFSGVKGENVSKVLCFSKRVCYDTANRLIYEGFDPEKIEIFDSDDPHGILDRIASSEADEIRMVTRLDTFIAMKKIVEKENAN